MMSFNNSSAVDRVICLFQAHGLSEKRLWSAQASMRVSTVQ